MVSQRVVEWRVSLPQVATAWEEALRERRDARETAIRSTVSEWRSEIESLRDEHAGLVASGSWLVGPDDLLSVIGRSRREVIHCRIIAWLLDPTGRHGFGLELLKAVLGRVLGDGSIPEDHLVDVRPETEVVRPRSRADIVLRGSEVTVVFEVKIDALERPNQCADLYDDFAADPDPHFIFMTPEGRKPQTAADEFVTFDFKDLARLLKCVQERRQQDSGFAAINLVANYERTLAREFL